MGSFIARDYISKYGSALAGVTICGAAGVFRNASESRVLLERLVAEGKGNESDAGAVGTLLGWLGERCGEIQLGNEWIMNRCRLTMPTILSMHSPNPPTIAPCSTLSR